MGSRSTSLPLVSAVILGLFLVTVGCNKEAAKQSPADRNIKALAILFGKYSSKNRGASPPSEVEFKKFIKALPAEDLSNLGLDVSEVDSIFVSPRDQQPFQIAYKSVIGPPGPQGSPIVVWENYGQGGKRLTADGLGKITEIDENQLQQRIPPKGK